MLCCHCLCEVTAGWHSASAPPPAPACPPLGRGVLAWQELLVCQALEEDLTLRASGDQAHVSLLCL